MPVKLATRTKTYPVALQSNLKYGTAAIRAYDVYYPDVADVSGFPIVVILHGGGWQNLSKTTLASFPQIRPIARLGYVVYSLNFTNCIQGDASTSFPVNVTDIRCFLGFLGEGLGMGDTTKITIWGYSSGSHLGLLHTLAPKSTWVEAEHPSSNYTIVNCIVGSTPCDLSSLYTSSAIAQQPIEALLGYVPASNPAGALIASPSNYVSGTPPPIYMSSGTADVTIPDSQTIAFVAQCALAGITIASASFVGYDHADSHWFDLFSQPFVNLHTFVERFGR